MENYAEKIRFAVLEDAEQILKIYAPYILNTPVSFEYEVPSLENFKKRMVGIMETHPYLVYERDGKIIGYAYASPYLTRRGFGWDAEVSIYLDQEEQGKEIGRLLYEPLLDMLKEMGVVNVYALIVHPHERSEKFHQKMGFQQEAIFEKTGYKLGQWLDLVYMKKQLNPYTCPPQEGSAFEQVKQDCENRWKQEEKGGI